MAITPSDGGYFDKNGVIKTDAFVSPSRLTAKGAATQPDSEIKNQAARATAAAVAEAAVIKISSRLDVGATGFDAGVRDTVREATAQGLAAIAKRRSGSAPDSDSDAAKDPAAPLLPHSEDRRKPFRCGRGGRW